MKTIAPEITVEEVNTYFRIPKNSDQFIEGLKECYKNPRDIYNRVLSINNRVFILKNLQIKGYLFYRDEDEFTIDIDGIITKVIYNGFVLVNKEYRKTGTLKDLLKFATEFYRKNSAQIASILFYAVTSNPIALKGYYKIFETARPKINETFTSQDLKIAAELKKMLFVNIESRDNPFIFKTALPQRYTENIKQTFLHTISNENKFLQEFNVDEDSGDRFLFYWIINN